MKTTLPYAFSRLGNGCKRFLLLMAAVFSFSLAAVAAPYYWVGGSGNWSDVSHWASTSNGAGFAYIQAPTQNDDVYFNQWSFTGPGQVVTVNVAAVCNNLSTLGSTNLYTGVSAPAINIVGPQLDILGNVSLAAGMRYFNGTKRFIKDAAAYTLDFNSVPMSGSMIFDGLNSNFNLLSALAGNTDLVVNRGVVNSGNQSITLRSITISAVSTQRGLSLGSSTVNLNGAFVSPNTLASDPNLVMSLNNSTINLYSTSPAFALRDYTFNKINVYSTYGPSFTADITNTATIADLIFYDGNKVSSTGLVKITDSLTLSPGNTYALGAITLTAAAKFIANGTCGKKIQIVADVVNPLSATATIQKTGGWAGVNINSCILANVQFTGGGTVSATQSYTLGTTSGVTLLASTPTTYYWVGGTGVWDDGLHWALASGGTVSGCVPGPTDNVVFDGSSFTATGQTVNLSDSADTWCAAMNWTGSNYNPTFKYKTSPWNGSALYIGGSLTTISGMNWSVVATVNFVGTGTITSAGNSFLSTLNFVTTAGGYSLADNLLVNGVISFTSGQFNTNNYNVTSNGWVSSNNNNRILQTGSSLLFIYNYFSAALTSCFTLGGANLTADFSNATINIRQMVNGYQDAYSFPPTLYKKVLIENPSNYTKTAGSVFLSATGATFDSLCLQSPTSLAGNMTFRKTLQLGSGTYLFGSLNVYTFQPAATISRFGTPGCANLITLANSYPGLTATFAKSSGSLLVDYAKLTYIRTSGAASFVANNSVDLGGNSGWVINTSGVSARTLYWVGNGGNWNDVNHWSLSTGGTPGECVPTRGDSVLFDANSFSLAAQTVTIDITTAECKAMNWTGVTNLPSLAGAAANNMAVYGSLLLSNGMVLTAQCPFVLMGANAHVVQSGGNTFSTAGLSVNGTGSYTLADKLTSNGLLRISSGVFNSNNMDVTVGALSLTGGQLAMGNSQWNLTGFYLGYAWAVAGANNVNAGTSTINVLLNFAPKFGGGNNKYHIVTAANPTFFESGNFDVIRPSAAGATFGSITIYDSLSLYPGGNYYFVKGGTVSFSDTAVFYARGTASQMINLESTQAGTQYTLMKNTGLVCTDFLNLYDSRATGTSIFTAGANTIDRGNNSGWDFSPYPAAGNGSLTGGIKCGGSPYMLRFDISAGSYPMDIILKNLNTGKRDTLFGVTSSPAYFAVSPSATNNFQVQAIIVNRCSQVVTGPFNTVAVNVPVGVLGQWTNAAGTNDWFDCRNWGNGIVPDSFTNVVITSVGASNIAAQGAQCNNVTINTGGQLALTNANASIAIHGTITNSGLFNASNGRVELAGAAAQTIPPSVNVFDSLVINNRSTTGVNLSGNDVTVKKTLLLLTGKVNTGVKLINVTNTAGAAVAGHSTASYVNGNLKRNITATGSFDFPVGSSTQYQLATFNSNAITGVSDITARFDPFVSIPTDTMLPPLYYTTTGEYAHGLLDHGYWTLNPNAPMTGGNYDVVLQARGYTNPAAQQFRYIMVKKDAGSGFLWDINQGYNDPSTQQQTASVVTTKRSSYTSFSNFAIAKLDALGTLGVNLISFTGTALSGGSNTINWTTDKSASGMYFMLERSSNGTAFSVVSLIKASENAAGNKYHFTDKDAGSGTVYYRLKVSQQDGSSFYSKIIKLRSTEETAIRVTPMPSARKVEVDINGSTADEQFVFQMIDNQGRQLIYLPIQAGHSSVQTGNFPDGIYVVKIIRTKHPAFIKRISWNRQ